MSDEKQLPGQKPDSMRAAQVHDWELGDLKIEVQFVRREMLDVKRRLTALETDLRLLDRSERSTIPPAPKGIRSIVPAVQRSAPQITAGTIAATLVLIIDQLVSLWMARGH